LILCQIGRLGFHGITTTTWGLVLDKSQTKWSTTILITGEFLDSGFGVLSRVEANNTSSTGSSIWFVLDFGLLDLSDGGEELDKILVAC
jgi:hypothetical protein